MSDSASAGPPPGWYPHPRWPTPRRIGTGPLGRSTPRLSARTSTPIKREGITRLEVGGYACAVLLPIVGVILGIVLVIQRRYHHGLLVILLSFAVWFVAAQIFMRLGRS